ncbi:Aldo/keto reductase [Aureobasidium pullulans]|nr:Aldo/keto reductase [Aureobasidium pullulans]
MPLLIHLHSSVSITSTTISSIITQNRISISKMAVVANILETRQHLMPAIKFWVSPLCLEPSDPGNSTPGHRDRVILFDILDAFHRAGGNFINIASNPRKPWIEKTIGYWMKMRNTRKDMLIAISSESGVKADSVMDSLESSLRRLDRPWVDIFYVHQVSSTVSGLSSEFCSICSSVTPRQHL